LLVKNENISIISQKTPRMKKIFTLIILSTICSAAHSQDLLHYHLQHKKITKLSMLTLGGWGGTNLITGVIGSQLSDESTKYFHQMNAGWNTVNFALAAGGLLQLKKYDSDAPLNEILRNQYKTEKILLFNAALDVSYIGAGAFLNYRSSYLTDDAYYRNKGFGNSLIIQGAFLLVFDTTVYLLHKKNRLKNLEPVLLKSLK
jgi:hypothetical protein